MKEISGTALLLFFLWTPGQAFAQTGDPGEFFEKKIRPLFSNHCISCHGPKLQTAGLDLSTEAGFRKGSEHGPVITPQDPENSRLLRVLSHSETVKMPPTGKLGEEQLADLRSWVRMGSPWSNAESSRGKGPAGRLWSFEPVKLARPPEVRDTGWLRNEIDNFILAKLEEKGIRPALPADKTTLLRRATLDLTGLPPTKEEIRAFLADTDPEAFSRVIERLLASPRYGERWGRHWLDVARYADSTGLDEDHRYPYAWRYRDYVIEAFNRDLPFDRFIHEQIAGDLLPPEKPREVNARGIVATGFLALGPKPVAQQDKMQMVYDVIDEQIDVTSKAFLGLTVSCARCHDHKFDPISTRDYYALASIFAGTKSFSKIEGTVSRLYFEPLEPREIYDRYQEHQTRLAWKKTALDHAVDEEATQYGWRLLPRMADYMIAARKVYGSGASAAEAAGRDGLDEHVLERWVQYLKPNREVRPHLEDWYAAGESSVPGVARAYQDRSGKTASLRAEHLLKWKLDVIAAVGNHIPPPERPKLDETKDRFFSEVFAKKGPFGLPEEEPDKLFSSEVRERIALLRGQIEDLKKASPPEPAMACAVAEGDVVRQRVFIRGNYRNPGEEVGKGVPLVLAEYLKSPAFEGSGRLTLARWLTDPDHPLTARVAVNRIWRWHFGEGLVRTVSNFGRLGETPSHPELLDYLAARFVDGGWSIKSMHRLMMLSNTYQMSSQVSAAQMESDPGNRLLSRFNRRRMDVEEIRDALLALDGSLDATMGGTLQTGTGTDGENSEKRLSFNPDESRRRTVYLPLRRSNLPGLLNLFDFGDATTTSEGRSHTNVAPQALFMMNSKFVEERSLGFAGYVLRGTSPGDESIADNAYRIALGRAPSGVERAEALGYVREFRRRLSGPDAALKAWQSFCRALIASNEFIFVD